LIRVRRALISVSDKTGVVELARALAGRGIQILSTGGTARSLIEAGLAVREVASYTGFPEIMDGRLKTLHPKIHGGLLGRRGIDEAVMALHQIEPIDLLVVNLYPFAMTVQAPGVSDADAIENIDIGGPAMLRAAAKNHESVAVVVEPHDYPSVLEELTRNEGCTTLATRARLAAKAFTHTAEYDALIARFLARRQGEKAEGFPASLALFYDKARDLRYGENPHQRAALYRDPRAAGVSIATALAAQGTDLSFNNIADADTALECVRGLASPACVIVKHMNPCGAAVARCGLEAYELAHRTDPTSAFGGIIAFNCELDARTTAAIIERQFVEVVVAPAISEAAAQLLATRPRVRALAAGDLGARDTDELEYRSVTGGLLAQTRDATASAAALKLTIVTRRAPDETELEDLRFAWHIARFVKSNAIVYAHDRSTIGIGAGQMSRVDSSRLAAMKAADAGLVVRGAVMASDAFFPFRDGLDVAAEQGIRAVIQPGGSRRDAEVIEAADSHGMAMVFTGSRHFRH